MKLCTLNHLLITLSFFFFPQQLFAIETQDEFGTLNSPEIPGESIKRAIVERKIELARQSEELDKLNHLNRIPDILSKLQDSPQPDTTSPLPNGKNYIHEFSYDYMNFCLNPIKVTLKSGPLVSQPSLDHLQTCSLCMTEITQSEEAFLAKCGHRHHFECINPGLQSYLRDENPKSLILCPAEGCCYTFTPSELASLVTTTEQALAIQRLFVRSFVSLRFCPHCSEGIAQNRPSIGFGQHCQECSHNLCFSCGKPPHPDISCEEINTDEGVKIAFINELLRSGESGFYGLCPNCSTLIEKMDGCSTVTCGTNAPDKPDIGSFQDRGCGRTFNWNSRIRLNQFADSTSIASGSPPPTQTSAITVLEWDPRFVPSFAAFGPMHLINHLVWSGLVRNVAMKDLYPFVNLRNLGQRLRIGLRARLGLAITLGQERNASGNFQHAPAANICASLGNGSRLPTHEEYEALTEDTIQNHPELRSRWFWTSTLDLNSPNDFALDFNGNTGELSYSNRKSFRSVRCVKSVP